MGVPLSQMWSVATYLAKQKLRGERRFPFVLMIEPLYRCNLACAGCGKIQYPSRILKKQLSVEECLRAVDACPAPVVVLPGGEPLLHPQIEQIAAGIVAKKKYLYLCTNALLLEQKLDLFTPSRYLSFSVHLDGDRETHDHAVCRDGVYDKAVAAIRAALDRGFRVTTNTTLFEGADPDRTARFFDTAMALGVEGMMVSPGYSYAAAPDQQHFLAGSARASSSAACSRARARAAGASTSRRSSSSSSPARATTTARPGVSPPTRSSAGSAPATCCRRATRRASRS
jgi:hopanoid biosynthesis associated radical SAM protein HpnH